MKIGIVTTSFPLTADSSSGSFILRLIEHFPPEINVTVLTPCHRDGMSISFEKDFNLKCFRYAPRNWQIVAHQPGGIPTAVKQNRLSLLLLPMFLLSMFLSCLRLARKTDLLHANWAVNGFIAGIAGILTGTPVITTLRGTDMQRATVSRIDRTIVKNCLVLNRKIVAVSNTIRDNLINWYPHYGEKISMIPNGVSSELLKIDPLQKKRQISQVKFLILGNLIKQKGVETAIEALKILGKSSKVKLNIVGDGPEMNNLMALAKNLAVDSKVDFIGRVPPGEVSKCLEESDALVLCSYSEGRPNAVLEAMAAGRPVIGTSIDGVRELIEENVSGFLFAPGNTKMLAEKMNLLEGNRELSIKMGKAGREYIYKNKLLWSETALRYKQIYGSIKEKTNA